MTKKTPAATEVTTSALDSAIVTEEQQACKLSPRQARVVSALSAGGWLMREAIDRVAGSSNGPDVVRQLRCKLGSDAIETQLVGSVDRDGKPCLVGRYALTANGRARLAQINVVTRTGDDK